MRLKLSYFYFDWWIRAGYPHVQRTCFAISCKHHRFTDQKRAWALMNAVSAPFYLRIPFVYRLVSLAQTPCLHRADIKSALVNTVALFYWTSRSRTNRDGRNVFSAFRIMLNALFKQGLHYMKIPERHTVEIARRATKQGAHPGLNFIQWNISVPRDKRDFTFTPNGFRNGGMFLDALLRLIHSVIR